MQATQRVEDKLITSHPGFFLNKYKSNGALNKVQNDDKNVHNWYRFVLSFPPHLARDYLKSFKASSDHVILDPFCGTGTTLVEAKKNGINSIGIEANPMAHFASTVKTNWSVDSKGLLTHAEFLAKQAEVLFNQPLKRLSAERESLLIKNSISPLPLHKTLVLLKLINDSGSTFAPYERLALSKSTVFESSNLHFGPEVGVRSCKEDADVLGAWLKEVEVIAKDICVLNKTENFPLSSVHYADARSLGHLLGDQSIDFVITSPPYPNEKDYTRTTRLESVLMGFIANKADLRKLKHGLVRSNTRSIYSKDTDDKWVENMKNIQEIAHKIEQRRIELGKTSGFERNYARVTRLYFGGMARHLADLRPKLKRGALLAYVVGDQASYLRVMIRTGQLLGEIAKTFGYELVNIDLFRTRISTSTKEQLREEVVILRWPK